ncbi:MAG: tRNA dihydrouridine synthase [Nannocystaceae bacterium]|nr:tRNA-dihydrouridine synthase family protein [bacterium]
MSVVDARIARRPDAPGLFAALAPMDGVTDWVYRDLLTRMHGGDSGISLCVSEFVRVTRSVVVPKVILRHCPEVETGGRTAAGVPVFVQILGGQPEPMAGTAIRCVEMGAPGIDINFGCPSKTVNGSDGGATILQCPQRLEAITAAVRRAVPESIPVTVKIRLGWENAEHVEDIVRSIEQGGATWLTIHGRTRMQGYRPPVDWSSIGRAREAVRIPVVANGDLNTVADVEACRRVSGCTAFMIGRGSMGRPRLFRQLRGHRDPELDAAWLCARLREYVRSILATGGSEGVALGRSKQWLRLAAPASPIYEGLFTALKRSKELSTFLAGLTPPGMPEPPTQFVAQAP